MFDISTLPLFSLSLCEFCLISVKRHNKYRLRMVKLHALPNDTLLVRVAITVAADMIDEGNQTMPSRSQV